MSYDQRHGGPYDRGGADKYYERSYEPHYYVGDTALSDRIKVEDMTADEIAAYAAGYSET
jgi:hypothetical protein